MDRGILAIGADFADHPVKYDPQRPNVTLGSVGQILNYLRRHEENASNPTSNLLEVCGQSEIYYLRLPFIRNVEYVLQFQVSMSNFKLMKFIDSK